MFIKSAKKKNDQQPAVVTMRDVAQHAGVSSSTVSRILNQTAVPISVSEETRRKVLEAVEILGYHPNMTARALRTQRTQMIAVMVADIANSFYHSIARAIQDFFVQHNYDVLIANSDHMYDNERRFCQAMMRRPVDGIIMVPHHLTSAEIAVLLERTGASISVLGSHIDHPLVDQVWSDDSKATIETVNWLINQRGHTDIGYIRAPLIYPSGQRRFLAYQSAMYEAGLLIQPEWVQEGDYMIAGGQHAMRMLLQSGKPPRAIMVSNDLMAIGAMNIALDAGYRIPEDIAIVGFDDIPIASLIRPPLTTIAQFPTEMGTQLAQLVYNRIEGLETGPARRVEIPLRLIERQSA